MLPSQASARAPYHDLRARIPCSSLSGSGSTSALPDVAAKETNASSASQPCCEPAVSSTQKRHPSSSRESRDPDIFLVDNAKSTTYLPQGYISIRHSKDLHFLTIAKNVEVDIRRCPWWSYAETGPIQQMPKVLLAMLDHCKGVKGRKVNCKPGFSCRAQQQKEILDTFNAVRCKGEVQVGMSGEDRRHYQKFDAELRAILGAA